MPISNPEVEVGDKTDGIMGYKKRRVSLKQGLASVFCVSETNDPP